MKVEAEKLEFKKKFACPKQRRLRFELFEGRQSVHFAHSV